ncbi:MAG: B12-binding domain-containing radical SAM protein, partial [Candidatus Bathyarchaeia archaeon]
MTNVLLVNPPEKTDITRVLELRAPPMSLMYLGASLEQAGLSVEILDANLFDMSMPQIQHEIGKRSIDFIGATCTTATVKNGMRIVNRARKALPDVVTALGGVHPTFLPARTLQECPELDMVVVGEGENTIVELSRALDGFRWGDHNRYKDEKAREFVDRLSKVNGLALRDPDDPYNTDKVKLTPPRPYIKDLDTVPLPARHLVPFDQYRLLGKTTAIGTVITSRGCPYACGYCSSTRIAGIRFRARSPKNVMEEISLLHDKYRLETIEFIDDIFTLNQKRAMEFCGMVHDYGLDID